MVLSITTPSGKVGDEGLRRGAARVEYARQAYLVRAVKPTTYGGGTSGTYGRAVANWSVRRAEADGLQWR
jgi:hypothetical protein